MEELVLFIMTFLLVYIFYQMFIIKSAKRRNSKKRPAEVNYLIYKYNIDIKKLNYKKFLNVVAITSSLDISLIVSIVSIIKSTLIEILLALVIVIPLFLLSYHLVGKYYIKKGYVKNV